MYRCASSIATNDRAVSINHMGPFNFLLDTGTQMTMLDPALAATLQLSTSGTAEVASAGGALRPRLPRRY